ncbi:GspE/PulE family protein [Allofranklinella schreckenbergeri]
MSLFESTAAAAPAHQPISDPAAASRHKLGELLVQAGKLGPRDLERALAAQQEMGGMLGRVLIRLGVVSEADLMPVLAQQLGVPLAKAEDYPQTPLEAPGLAPGFLRTHNVFPLWLREGGEAAQGAADNAAEAGALAVAMAVPQDEFVCKALHLATGLRIVPYLGLESDIERALDQAEAAARQAEEASADDLLSGLDAADFVEHLKDLASEAPVIKLVNTIIGRVIDMRASDIHLEPFEDGLHVRYRVDGVIHVAEIIPQRLAPAVGSRVKLLAHLDIAERRLPQDGRIKTRVKGRELDLRVSTVPTVYGESIVMRVLDRASVRLNLDDMGFAPDTLARFNELLAKPHGIFLVTGPTGSGKTTTLYAGLAKLDADSQKIITVEDPVEYQLAGINQIQVHPQINLTFANALRAILRQDPDIIMIGEMRDGETAQIAVQSALTGHLVLSTLHTNTAPGAIVRMEDMGVERYLITSSVNGVLAQRLVRTLCPHCKQPHDLAPHVLEETGLARFLQPGQTLYRPVGCEHCRGSGYKGRTGIHELMVLDEVLRRAILDGKDAAELGSLAAQRGMLSLYEDGLRKAAAGVTSLEEVTRVTQDQSDA